MDDPPKEIHRFLISTTSRFIGTYNSPSIRIDHAWTFGGGVHRIGQGLRESPYSRNYFVLSVSIEEPKVKTVVMPDYNPLGDQFCAILSILFGKRFDSHGLFFSQGFFRVPDLSNVAPISDLSAAPFSHQPRKDFCPPLDLSSFELVASLFTDEHSDEKFIRILFAAARFYLRSLQVFEQRAEFAYLDLVTCGEILSNYYSYASDVLLDQKTKEVLERIREGVADGDSAVRHLEARMRQIKKRYTLTLMRLLTPSFFVDSETGGVASLSLKQHDIERRLKASYDLRSQYLHTGVEFDRWIRPGTVVNEVQFGKPTLADKNLAKAIELAPTYFGLERVIRYCLLRFIHLHGVEISTALGSPGG